jgi:outer membrane protein OmpA-like peptidoglycan-associated protein
MKGLLIVLSMLFSFGLQAQGRKLPPFSFQEHSTAFANANRTYSQGESFTESDTLTDEVILATLAKILRDHEALIIELQGHTALNENPDLGLQRALLIQTLLIERGIDKARIQVANLANDQPLLSQEIILSLPTQTERAIANQKNRRVEVNVIAKSQE